MTVFFFYKINFETQQKHGFFDKYFYGSLLHVAQRKADCLLLLSVILMFVGYFKDYPKIDP